MKSIRRQLLASLLSTLVLVSLCAALGIYLTVEREFSEIFDYELKQVAFSFREDSLHRPIAIPTQILEHEDDLVIQIWDRDGALVYVSDALPVLPSRTEAGYSRQPTPGAEWRVFNVRLREHTIQVAQPMSIRQVLAARAALRTLLPVLMLAAALGAVIWIIVGRALRPLNEVTSAVEKRSASALQPLPAANLPIEVKPLIAALADAREIDIGFDGDVPAPLTGDPESLRVMLGNLIDNAIRYTHRGGKIDVRVSVEEGETILRVKDNGPGMRKDFRARAFDRFSRQEGSGEPGGGVGLAIVHNVVVRHGGFIALAAGDDDRGLCVTVRFPTR